MAKDESPTPAESRERGNLAILLGIRYANECGECGECGEDPYFPFAPAMLFDASMHGGICFPEGKDGCLYTVENYQPDSRQSHQVKITLARKSGARIIWSGLVDGLALSGLPELVWE